MIPNETPTETVQAPIDKSLTAGMQGEKGLLRGTLSGISVPDGEDEEYKVMDVETQKQWRPYFQRKPTGTKDEFIGLSIFVLRFKDRGIVVDKNFEAEDLYRAIALGREWCSLTSRKFINVSPFCMDIEKEILEAKREFA